MIYGIVFLCISLIFRCTFVRMYVVDCSLMYCKNSVLIISNFCSEKQMTGDCDRSFDACVNYFLFVFILVHVCEFVKGVTPLQRPSRSSRSAHEDKSISNNAVTSTEIFKSSWCLKVSLKVHLHDKCPPPPGILFRLISIKQTDA